MVEFTLGRCRIQLHFLFLAALVIILFTDLRGTAMAGIAAALLHELGHLLMMTLWRVPPKSVTIQPFGVVIQEGNTAPLRWYGEAMISLAGPMANFLAAALSLAVSPWIPTELFLLSNLALGLFNLLPVESLDGGRVIAICFAPIFSSQALSRLLTILSLCCIFPMATLGFLSLLSSPWNFSLLLVSVYLMLCLVLRTGGQRP